MGEKPRIARSRATSAPSSTVPSTSPFAATRIACSGRRGGVASHARHTRAFLSQRARARTYMKGTQDIKHDAALPHSLRRRWCLRGRSASEIEGGCACARAGGRVEESGVRGRREGDVGAAGDARPPPAYPGGAERSTRHPRGAPFEDGWMHERDYHWPPTTSEGAPAPEECAFELDADAVQLVPVDHTYGHARIYPTAHSHRARRRSKPDPRPSFLRPLSLIRGFLFLIHIRDSDASTSDTSIPAAAAHHPWARPRSGEARRRWRASLRAGGVTRVCFAARDLGETARKRLEGGGAAAATAPSPPVPATSTPLDAPRTPAALSRPRRRSRGYAE
ncbi:hypothetical protein DFH09DRAFT_1375514 [Mycena vulgaris]|nr:hypothetical protein DFH09DRAFT_1375514 [Mycena vulgaris]